MSGRRRSYSRQPHLWRRTPRGPYYIVWTEDGNTRKLSTKTTERIAAEAALRAFLEDYAHNQHNRRLATFHTGIQEWLADRERPRQGLAACTLKLYRHWTRLFLSHFPSNLLVDDVTPRTIRQFLDKREDGGVGPSTLKKDLGCLSMIFKFLVREGIARGNPCDAVSIRASVKRHPAMTGEEFTTLRSELSSEVEGADTPEDRRGAQDLLDLVDVLWLSGLRFVEATRLEWDDVNFSGATWTIRSPYNKGGTQTLPLHSQLISILRRRKLSSPSQPFPGYWHFSNLWRAFKRHHPEFKGWSLHRIRHSFVTRLRLQGRDAAALALARHKTPAMSAHYTHINPIDLRGDLDAL